MNLLALGGVWDQQYIEVTREEMNVDDEVCMFSSDSVLRTQV